MLRLWPETSHVGLFPGHCWLRRGRKGPEQALQSPISREPAALLRALEKMLDEQAAPLRKGSRLALTVSDSVAAIALLPWQEELRRPAEINSYARICFEKLGYELGGNWVMHAEFRQYGGLGIAYALPREWLEALLALIAARGYRLSSVLPVSAIAFSRQRFSADSRIGGCTLLLLQEAQRSSAMIYGAQGLLGYDVEPLTQSAEQTRMRLLSRVTSAQNTYSRVRYWTAESAAPTIPADLAPALFPGADMGCLPRCLSHGWGSGMKW